MADRIVQSLERREALQTLRKAARQTVIDRYSLKQGEARFRG
jgi:hypothetical protein